MKSLFQDWRVVVAVIGFAILSSWWVFLFFTNPPEATLSNQTFAAAYGVMALWGGFWGVVIATKWGGFSSVVGRAIMMFGLGLLFQEFGQLTYTYYIYFLQIEVPYPSIGDIGYFGSIFFYIYGAYLTAKAAGVKISFRSYSHTLRAIIIPIVILSLSYYFFLIGYEFDWSNPLVIFLDFGYPLGQAFYISIAFLAYFLTRGMLGGIMKRVILFLLFALLIQYVADYIFLYQAYEGTWYAGGFNDYLYLVSYFTMTLALLNFYVAYEKLKHV